MYNKHPPVVDYLGASAKVSLDKLEHGKYQISDGEKDILEATSIEDIDFKKRIADIPIEDAASVLNSALNFSQAAKSTQGTEALKNGKRPSDIFCGEVENKRAKKEDQEGNLVLFSDEPEWKFTTSVLNANGKSPAAANLCLPSSTYSIIEVDTRQGQPAGAPLFPGYEYLHRDVHSPLTEHSHRRRVPIGLHHQAYLPQCFKSSGSRLCFYDAPSSTVIESNEVSTDKWLGTCVIPMSMETQLCCSKEDCDCSDEGSIRCVRQHVMEAREKLNGAMGKKKFIELGFPSMGEDVAQRWTEEEEKLFHMIVLSNSASLGRNFWAVLPHSFPSRSLKEIVSYYFNVFILRKRADQNRMDPLNVDSDNDEWQECSAGEFEMSEEEEEEDSVVESPAYENSLTVNDDTSEELGFDEEEYEEDDGTEDEGFYCGSDESTGYKPIPHCKMAIDGNSRDCLLDQDVQDDSCTSLEGPCNFADSRVERDQENLQHMEDGNNCLIGFTDHEYIIDGPHDSKPWEINYIRATEKDFDFFPTCNVLEEVFGKGYEENDVRDGSVCS